MTDHLTYSLPVPGPVKGCTRPQGQARDILYLNFLDFQEYFKTKLIYFNQFKSIVFKTKKEG